ncbi:hypothetical protein FQA39_LY05648 [Lamprigera yunnana]|nr:hypothetical protein FQA39_LY05648 [Lamprigera yunnana]
MATMQSFYVHFEVRKLIPHFIKINKAHHKLVSTGYNYLYSCKCRFQSTEANKINTDQVLVYYGSLTPQLRAVKLFSLFTSVAGIAAQPILYHKLMELGSLPLAVVGWSFFGFFTIGTPILLHLIVKKYVSTLKYDTTKNTYIATTFNLFNFKKNLEFTPDDVKVPEVLGMFTSFTVKGTPLFVDPRSFKNPKHYGKIMGYDKPVDLKLFMTSLNEKKRNS